jgi:hypothetical protein
MTAGITWTMVAVCALVVAGLFFLVKSFAMPQSFFKKQEKKEELLKKFPPGSPPPG